MIEHLPEEHPELVNGIDGALSIVLALPALSLVFVIGLCILDKIKKVQ